MVVARRDRLSPDATHLANAGLALDRYLERAVGTDSNAALGRLYDRVVGLPAPELYRHAFARWEALLRTLPAGQPGACLVLQRFAARGRLIVGLGGESVLETGITLNRQYGVPYLPGAALKGLARHLFQARHQPATSPPAADAVLFQQHMTVLFGEQAHAGHVTWFDAWYDPASVGGRPLVRDVITVHHPDYYGSQGQARPPWDFDDPIPTAFLSARGTYLVALLAPNRAWATFAVQLVSAALGEAQWGIGGKTGSGYGRLTPMGQATYLIESGGPST